MSYVAGLDVGQATDPSALAIAERIPVLDGKPRYHFVHLERLKLGTPYPAQVAHVKALIEHPSLKSHVTLALDFTGVGRPIFDMFRAARIGCPLYGVSIHGGEKVTWDEEDPHLVRVPKRDLIASAQVLLQSSRLKIAEQLPEAGVLVKELLNFRVKIDPATAHDSYSAWREAEHDDLVLAVALAGWIGEAKGAHTPVYESVATRAASGLAGKGAY